jgi:hypothetical protein
MSIMPSLSLDWSVCTWEYVWQKLVYYISSVTVRFNYRAISQDIEHPMA